MGAAGRLQQLFVSGISPTSMRSDDQFPVSIGSFSNFNFGAQLSEILNRLLAAKMASASDPKRQLKIKTGVVKRLAKEKQMYEKEVVEQGQKVDKMKADNKDEYDIKKQIEVLEESKIMIPDCKRRLKTAYEDLTNLIDKTQEEFGDTEEHKNAKEILETTVLED